MEDDTLGAVPAVRRPLGQIVHDIPYYTVMIMGQLVRYCKTGNIRAQLNLANLALRNKSLKLMVCQNCFYKGSKLNTTYKTLILMAANMWSLLNIMVPIFQALQ